MGNKLPTIKEIAKKLGVSVSTVSRALNDNQRIGEKTRLKVQELAKQLNYEPNPKAIYFKQKRSFVIGVIVPDIYEDFFSKAITGIEDLALEHGYTLLFGQSHNSLEKEKQVLNAIKRQRVDGLLISLSKETSKYAHLVELEKYEIPIVYFDRVPNLQKVHKVYSNLQTGTFEMVNWLFKQGKRRIAFINGPQSIIASKERLKGYIEAVAKHKLKVDMQMVEETDLTETSTIKATNCLLSLKKRPDAIITFNDYVHLDAVKQAEKLGISINKEIAFVSYANISLNKYTAYPPLASIDQGSYKQGYTAMEIMMKILDSPEKDIVYDQEIPSSLVFS